MIEVGKKLTFLCKLCPPEATPYINNVNSKPETALKHPASLSRYVQVNKKSKYTATARQQITLTAYSSGSIVFISQPQLDNLALQNIVGELQFQC